MARNDGRNTENNNFTVIQVSEKKFGNEFPDFEKPFDEDFWLKVCCRKIEGTRAKKRCDVFTKVYSFKSAFMAKCYSVLWEQVYKSFHWLSLLFVCSCTG